MFDDFSDDYGEGPYSGYDYSSRNFDFSPGLGGLTYAGGDFGYQDLDFAGNIFTDPELFAAFAEANPEDAEILRTAFLGGQARDIDDASISEGVINTGDPDNSYKTAETEKFKRQTGGVPVGDPDDPMGTKKLADISGDKTSLPDKLKKLIADVTGLGEDTIGELGKYGLLAGIAKLAYDDAENARKAKLGYIAPGGSAKRAVISPGGSVSYTKAASGGIMSLADGGLVVDDQGRTAQDKQKENLYRQLDAMDAWNTAGATREGAEAPWLMDQANRMMAVGVKDDFTGLGPGVLLYDPAKGQSEIVSSGNLSSWFERGDPAAAYEQAKNSLPYFQQKALLGIEGPTTQAQERRIVKTMVNNPLPALPFIEYGLGQFAPPNYGLDPNVARRREENKLLNRKEKPFEYFQDFLNLSPYQGGLPTIYQFPELTGYAEGGMTDKQPFYLGGPTDGMADEVPAHIDNQRPAALSDGEFVIPADVVSHLGNGNSNAGAKRLYEMMDNIRQARTGSKDQGVQINPNKFLPR